MIPCDSIRGRNRHLYNACLGRPSYRGTLYTSHASSRIHRVQFCALIRNEDGALLVWRTIIVACVASSINDDISHVHYVVVSCNNSIVCGLLVLLYHPFLHPLRNVKWRLLNSKDLILPLHDVVITIVISPLFVITFL
jgi:hypothetical protein